MWCNYLEKDGEAIFLEIGHLLRNNYEDEGNKSLTIEMIGLRFWRGTAF